MKYTFQYKFYFAYNEILKGVVLYYCILPGCRNGDLGTSFFNMVKEIEVSKGAKYFELNVSNKKI